MPRVTRQPADGPPPAVPAPPTVPIVPAAATSTCVACERLVMPGDPLAVVDDHPLHEACYVDLLAARAAQG